MKHYIILFIIGLLGLGITSCGKEKKVYKEGDPIEPEDIHWVVEYLIDSSDLSAYFPNLNVRSHLYKNLKEFYRENDFELAWNSHKKAGKQAEELIEVLKESWKEGLNPQYYRIEEMDSLEKAIFHSGVDSVDLHRLIHLDLLMTSSFLTYASHLVCGRVDPNKVNSTWFTNPPQKDFVPALKKAAINKRVKKAIDDIRPDYPQYKKLQEKFAEYHEIKKNGGWPEIAGGQELRRGNYGRQVAALNKRLAVTGDLTGYNEKGRDTAVFTEETENSVKIFQERHRLKPTGWVDKKTLQALNIPLEDRLQQIMLNMERLRWMPEDLGEHYILVNVPEYYLRIIRNEKVEMDMKVIVGQDFNSTPIFSDTMEHLVFSPYWNVPNSISTEEILPKAQENPDHLSTNNYELLSGWEEDPKVIDPYSVDWDTLSADNFPFRIRQKPGPGNALGKVKFMFPNNLSIYLHDTPEGNLFSRDERGFSHGCIRVEEPEDMAVYLLQNKPGYDRKRIKQLMEDGSETIVKLEEKVPVHIIYWTTFVDDNGRLNFSNDIYNFDKAQIKAIEKKAKEML